MAADANVEDILAIDSSLIPPGFTHGLQIAIPQSPQGEDTFQPEKLRPPKFQQRPFQRRPQQRPPPPRPQQKPQPIPQPIPLPPQQSELQVQSNLPSKVQSPGRGNSFCRWVRKKLWCIRGNSPMESLSNESAEGMLKEVPVTGDGSHADDLKKSVHDTSARSGQIGSGSIDGKSDKSDEGETRPKDRQVTFSDTVRTHIKTKYVTAEEYKQIRGMNAATGRIMYQIVKVREGDDHPKDKVNPFASNATRCKRRKPI